MDKILFLDIDGVLNSTQSARYHFKRGEQPYMELCPIAVSNLNYIIEKLSDLKIVISSSWRRGNDLDHLKSILYDQGVNVQPIIDVTPQVLSGDRGHEIHMWLRDNVNQNYKFVILDDDRDMGHLIPALIQTDYRVGLDWRIVEDVLWFFGYNWKTTNKISRL